MPGRESARGARPDEEAAEATGRRCCAALPRALAGPGGGRGRCPGRCPCCPVQGPALRVCPGPEGRSLALRVGPRPARLGGERRGGAGAWRARTGLRRHFVAAAGGGWLLLRWPRRRGVGRAGAAMRSQLALSWLPLFTAVEVLCHAGSPEG